MGDQLKNLKTAFNYFVILIILIVCCPYAAAREITDMVGRKVTVPDKIRKVYGSSPPSTCMVYAVDPGLVAGLNSPLNQSEYHYLDQRLRQLPVIGGWFGQGQVPNLETLLHVHPDIILDCMWHKSAANEIIERVGKRLQIPVVYIPMDAVADYPDAFLFLGKLLNRQERAQLLSRYARQTLDEIAGVRAAIPEDSRISVYYAEGADGLSTECHTSLHAQVIPLSGGNNVHRCSDKSSYGMQKISMEQVLQYNPDVIISHDVLFFSGFAADSKWKNIRAVRDGRVYRIPKEPFNWFDRPPSFMRLLGAKWLTHKLYPSAYPIDLMAETRYFYKLFLNISLDDAATRELLQP